MRQFKTMTVGIASLTALGIFDLLGLWSYPASVNAALLTTGLYSLQNHPEGNAAPPTYGLRLDELFNATGGRDIFTFDVNDPSSAMFLNYTGSSIHIYGQAFGGRDSGSGYTNDIYKGVYAIDFTYSSNEGLAPDVGPLRQKRTRGIASDCWSPAMY